ncbi:hypothetical protein SprV_0401592700 [Sparganum proliferum]
MFLECLPVDVQTILASGSEDLSVSRLTEMADRMLEVQRFQPPSVAQLYVPSLPAPSEQIAMQMAATAEEMAFIKVETGKPVSRRIEATVFSDSSGSGRSVARRRFLVDIGAQTSVVPPTPADRCFPSPGLYLQAANCFSHSHFWQSVPRPEHWPSSVLLPFFVVADVPHAVLGSDFLAESYRLVDCRLSRLLDRKTGLSVNDLTLFTISSNLSVLGTGIACPCRELLLQHPKITNPQCRSGEVQHDFVHHIRTPDPPVFDRSRRLSPARFQAAKLRFLPNCADLMLSLTNMLSGPKGPLELNAQLSLMVDASTVAVGAVLQQHVAGTTRPLTFFSTKLLPVETRYSTFGRELLAPYLAVKYFRHFLEGRDLTVFTDHKPLTFALRSHSDKYNPKEIAHLDYISQFPTDIGHIDGTKNEVGDMLSRSSLSSLQLSHGINLCAMATGQQRVSCPCDLSVSGLQFKDVPLTTGSGTVLCDVSNPSHRPFVSVSMRQAVFQTLHGLFHPGIRASQKLLAASIRAALKSDLDCSASGLVFGTTLRLPGEMVARTYRGADETLDNVVHHLQQFLRSLSRFRLEFRRPSPVSKKAWTIPLESPNEGPFRVLACNTKTCRILSGNKKDVVSVDLVKAVVSMEPPDLLQRQDSAYSLPRDPPPSLPHSPPPSPTPLSPTTSNPNSSNATGIRTTHSGSLIPQLY